MVTIQFSYRNIFLRNTNMDDLARYNTWFDSLQDWSHHGDPWGIQSYSKDDIRQMVQSNIQSVESEGNLTLEICNQEGHHFGSVEYYPRQSKADSGTVAIRICDPAFRGHGYGESALKGFLTWLFGERQVDHIICSVREGNRAMKRLVSKCGFRLFHLHTDASISDECCEDLLHFQVDSGLLTSGHL